MQQPTAQTVEAVLGAETVEQMHRFIIAARAYAEVADKFRPLMGEGMAALRSAGLTLDDVLEDGRPLFVGSIFSDLYGAHADAFNATMRGERS